jgi:hypothetical protein
MTLHAKNRSLAVQLVLLLFIWGSIIRFIDPAGDFMINDDWSFTIVVEALLDGGHIPATGWGGGGPGNFFHILWGWLFSILFGFSPTILRAGVLALAVCGSLVLLLLLCRLNDGGKRSIGFLASLILVFNPLFLSQSFTFMTDMTFAVLVVFSLFFVHVGIEGERRAWIVGGLFFALLATLTRQIGLFLPLGFGICCLLHPRARCMGLKKLLTDTVCIAVLPWLLFELLLWKIGSTPLTHHPVFHKIYLTPITKGFPDYPLFLLQQAGIMGLYIAFFLSPLFVLQWREPMRHKVFRRLTGVLLVLLLAIEAAIIAGLLDPPAGFHRNVIYDFGIGPLLLKDAYLLGVARTATLPPALFYLLVFWAVCSAAALLFFAGRYVAAVVRHGFDPAAPHGDFIALFAFTGAIVYAGVILLTGFHDRYLIPPCILLVVWFVSQSRTAQDRPLPGASFSAVVLLLCMAAFSVFGLKDFMTTKRAVHRAHTYLLSTLRVDPCDVDGGFEFNGYHCSERNRQGMDSRYSWWWVERETYLVGLGPLPGYRTLKTFPFSRIIGPDGAVYILQPVNDARPPGPK